MREDKKGLVARDWDFQLSDEREREREAASGGGGLLERESPKSRKSKVRVKVNGERKSVRVWLWALGSRWGGWLSIFISIFYFNNNNIYSNIFDGDLLELERGNWQLGMVFGGLPQYDWALWVFSNYHCIGLPRTTDLNPPPSIIMLRCFTYFTPCPFSFSMEYPFGAFYLIHSLLPFPFPCASITICFFFIKEGTF